MTKKEIENKVSVAVIPVLEGLGYELVEAEYINRGGQNILTLFIGNLKGISLDDCEKAHYAVDQILDELNPTNDAPYTLNISSPGLDRPLKSENDFRRNLNKKLDIKLRKPLNPNEKIKRIKGVLISKTENLIAVRQLKTDKLIEIETEFVESVYPLIEF